MSRRLSAPGFNPSTKNKYTYVCMYVYVCVDRQIDRYGKPNIKHFQTMTNSHFSTAKMNTKSNSKITFSNRLFLRPF